MAETIRKTVKHIMTDGGTYETVYQKTSADIVVCKDDQTVQKKVEDAETHHATQLKGSDGIHGMRYNSDTEMLEIYFTDLTKWVPVLFCGTYITTRDGEVITTRKGENLSLV